jgi:hypothetical protein
MKTETKSRLLLTALSAFIVAFTVALAFHRLVGGYPMWGILVAAVGGALLLWVWRPWQKQTSAPTAQPVRIPIRRQ